VKNISPASRNQTSDKDVAAFTKDASESAAKIPLTQQQRDHHSHPQPLVKIVNHATDAVIQASLEQLNQQMRDFRKVILLIEDDGNASDACTKALHELGYDGVQLITHVKEAVQHLGRYRVKPYRAACSYFGSRAGSRQWF
jgi:hypothetical protein